MNWEPSAPRRLTSRGRMTIADASTRITRTPAMSAGQASNTYPLESAADAAAAELAALRADNIALREQLTLRDQALDATPTFFVIAKRTVPEPTVVYCNKVVADEHGSQREEMIGKGIGTLARWLGHDTGRMTEIN